MVKYAVRDMTEKNQRLAERSARTQNICTLQSLCLCSYEPRHEKTNIVVSDQVRHKTGCTSTGRR